ncbi:MAG: hypothetical protein EU532_05400, partial [Promethearchaeota archaeon]
MNEIAAKNRPYEFCTECGAKVLNESIKNAIRNKKSAFCNYCGAEIIKFNAQNYNFKKEKIQKLVAKDFNRQTKLFICRIIYEILKSPEYCSNLKEHQRELPQKQIQKIAENITKSLSYLNIRNSWINKLHTISQKEFEKGYEKLQVLLKSNPNYQNSFTKYIEKLTQIIFKIINWNYDITLLRGFNLVVAEDLKEHYGFLHDPLLSKEFKYWLFIFMARIIYFTMKAQEKFMKLQSNESFSLEGYLLKLAYQLKENILKENKIMTKEWLNQLQNISLSEFVRNYRILQLNLNIDQIYCESFIKQLNWLSWTVYTIISKNQYEPEPSKFKQILMQDIKNIQKDKEFIKKIEQKQFREFEYQKSGKGDLNFEFIESTTDNEKFGTSPLTTDSAQNPPPDIDYENIFIQAENYQKYPVTAVIDTGSEINTIDSELVNLLSLKTNSTLQTVETYNGKDTKQQYCKATIIFRGEPLELDFYIDESLYNRFKVHIILS